MKVTITTPFARLALEMNTIEAANLMHHALSRTTLEAAPKGYTHGAYANLFAKKSEEADCPTAPAQPDETSGSEQTDEEEGDPWADEEESAPEVTITPPEKPVAALASDFDFGDDLDDTPPFSAVEKTPEKGYRGFLHIKCNKCHKGKSFHVKYPLKQYRCECGHTMPLQGLSKVVAKCDCGWDMKYVTNTDEDAFALQCISCDKPVPVKWNFRHKQYEKEN